MHPDHRAQHHYPVKKSQVFSTAADNQTTVDIHVLQGEREMAADNKTLGRFQLDGIPAARRGVPQIEVTFDIDANGIVNVSAKDLGTGKEQHITITSSSNMSKDDIDKAVKDAAAYAEQDKKRREDVDTRNNADQMIYQAEKTIADAGDKLDASDKAAAEAKIAELKTAMQGTDTEAIKTKLDELQKAFYEISEKLYKAAAEAQAAQQGPAAGDNAGAGQNADYVDTDYKDVDENGNK